MPLWLTCAPLWALIKPRPTPHARQTTIPTYPVLPYYLLTSKVTPVTWGLSFFKNVPKVPTFTRLKLSSSTMTLGWCQFVKGLSSAALVPGLRGSQFQRGVWFGSGCPSSPAGHLAFLRQTSPCACCHCGSRGRWLGPSRTRLPGRARRPDLGFTRAHTPASHVSQIWS